MANEAIKCPKCSSTQINVDKKGFGLGKAAVGGLALGPVGLLGGMLGRKKIRLTCLNCGHVFSPGEKVKPISTEPVSPGFAYFGCSVTIIILILIIMLIFGWC